MTANYENMDDFGNTTDFTNTNDYYNTTGFDTLSEHDEQLRKLQAALNILYPILSVVGISANLVVIVVLTIWERNHINRNVPNVFVLNLAIADLVFLFILPLFMPILEQYGWIYGEMMCKLVEGVKHSNFHASIMIITLMSLDRFFAVAYPLRSQSIRTRKTAWMGCVIVWCISVASTIPLFSYAQLETAPNSNVSICKIKFPGWDSWTSGSETDLIDLLQGYGSMNDTDYYGGDIKPDDSVYDDYGLDAFTENEDTEYRCYDQEHANSQAYIANEIVLFVFFFAIPVLLIILSYGSILSNAAASRAVQSTTASDAVSSLVIIVSILISAFLICWTPFKIWRLLQLPPGVKVASRIGCDIVDKSVTFLAWSNSALNPILYSISSKRFQTKISASIRYIRFRNKRDLTLKQAAKKASTSSRRITANTTLRTTISNSPTSKNFAKSPINKDFTNSRDSAIAKLTKQTSI